MRGCSTNLIALLTLTNKIVASIEIDSESGFCFGVVTAIRKAEEELTCCDELYCLGDIVHNSAEVERLRAKGLRTITHSDIPNLPRGAKMLLRAHGEPPSTYEAAKKGGIHIVDATCPVVLKLQQRIKARYSPDGPQIVIYGKLGHAEVNGLVGQTEGRAIVVEDIAGLDKVDFYNDIALYSQTTKSLEGFREIIAEIERRIKPGVNFESYDTICRQVANRVEHLAGFAGSKDIVLFVAGAKSSNGKVLYKHCLDINPRTYLIGDPNDLKKEMLVNAQNIGICGATSTPRWLMEDVAKRATDLIEYE